MEIKFNLELVEGNVLTLGEDIGYIQVYEENGKIVVFVNIHDIELVCRHRVWGSFGGNEVEFSRPDISSSDITIKKHSGKIIVA